MGCSSTPRAKRAPSVAIVINAGKSGQPSPSELAELHKLVQPEIERRGYVIAKSSRSADYFVHVRYPFDPGSIGRLTFERAEPTVPFLKDQEPVLNRGPNREYRRETADLVAEPSATKP